MEVLLLPCVSIDEAVKKRKKKRSKMQREPSAALNANKQRNYDLRRLQKRLSKNM